MHKRQLSFELTVFDALEELPDNDRILLLEAVAARDKAYAPYSRFKVGAALALANGMVVTGNNQENACYPSGLCAERVAIYHAGANHPEVVIETLAIASASQNRQVGVPAAPCGSCRQAIAEYEVKQKKNIRILMMGKTGKVWQSQAIGDLLPLAFTSSFL